MLTNFYADSKRCREAKLTMAKMASTILILIAKKAMLKQQVSKFKVVNRNSM